ncbi:segregation and condensation protein A [Sphingomicrobium aestuariivivum]|uniref:segregation and condensation protein A n=1 Tax=Sphingomicrobium aestuariivivum TaxID=1582356 RepID=UPI001FD711B6|nr:ScpA family protein [Sphingomicrobium aestuariivivum]MCJ8190640.1 segregation/condensation protein A [Sphingomicrobium aestuariivivum]
MGDVVLHPVVEDEGLTLHLEHWEGPLDLLLDLARGQKVDLIEISILELTEQFIAYIERAKALQLEVAADYLVMAAWLAYLKSCLLLPKDPEVDPSPEELAWRLQQRLMRLDAMREAGARLLGRDRVGRDVFLRAAPEGLRTERKSRWQVSAYDLFAAYGQVRARTQPAMHVVHDRKVMTLETAMERLQSMLGFAVEWTDLRKFLPKSGDKAFLKSCLASSFLASLELARTGMIELEQEEAFGTVKVKRGR